MGLILTRVGIVFRRIFVSIQHEFKREERRSIKSWSYLTASTSFKIDVTPCYGRLENDPELSTNSHILSGFKRP